jgi:hypothetical protein
MIVKPGDCNLEYIDTVMMSYREFTMGLESLTGINIEKLKDICKIILKVIFLFFNPHQRLLK